MNRARYFALAGLALCASAAQAGDFYLGIGASSARFSGAAAVTDATAARLVVDGFQTVEQDSAARSGGGFLLLGYRTGSWGIEYEAARIGAFRATARGTITNASFYGGPVCTGPFDESVEARISAQTLAGIYTHSTGLYARLGVARWNASQATFERSDLAGRTPQIVTNGAGVFGKGSGLTPVYGAGWQSGGRVFVRVGADYFQRVGAASGVTDGAEVQARNILRISASLGVSL